MKCKHFSIITISYDKYFNKIEFKLNINYIKMTGKVYIASMNCRGEWSQCPDDCLKVNVTSAQGKSNKNRLDFSPMTPIEGGYEGFWNFESFWQSGKVFENISEDNVKNYWRNLKEPKRRYPGSKGKKVLYSRFEHLPEEKMDYITSRKKVYVPKYFELIKNKEMTNFWKNKLESGNNIVIYDFDGPRKTNGEVTCLEVNLEILKEKINDVNFPFGHGYIIAAWIKGISPEKYI